MHDYSGLRQVVKYDLTSAQAPRRVDAKLSVFLDHAALSLRKAKIETVKASVVAPSGRWREKPEQVEFFVFGSFQSVYRTIDAVADVLAEVYIEHGILPIVRPVLRDSWEKRDPSTAHLDRLLRRRGALHYLASGLV